MARPPELENNAQFVALAKLFHDFGTPQLLAADEDNGFFLMEDLGSVHLHDVYQRAGDDQHFIGLTDANHPSAHKVQNHQHNNNGTNTANN